MPKIDNLVVFRCVQVVRRLLLKNREIGLFCNLSDSTLTDGAVFQQLLDFLDANRAIAPSVVLEFTQSALRAAGPIENEVLSALADRGFRFSLDNLQDLRIEPRDLAARGFRFIKVPGNLLLNPKDAATDIHPADLSDLLGRFGIDLIAEKIESEAMVVDLLDYDVRFGQGFLFSPPRPVRAEALQGIADRGDVIVREAGAADDAPAPDCRARGDEPRHQWRGRRPAHHRPGPARPRRYRPHLMPARGSSKSSGRANPSAASIRPRIRTHVRHPPSAAISRPSRRTTTCCCRDVWGVVHNGVAATAERLRRAAPVPRAGRHRRADHQCAAAGRLRADVHRPASRCRATATTRS